MFGNTIAAIDREQAACENKRQTLAVLTLLIKHLDKAPILNDAFATYDVDNSIVTYRPAGVVSRAHATCWLGFERCGTGQTVPIEISVFRDDESCSVSCCLDSTVLLHFDCENHAPTVSEREAIAAMLYGAIKTYTHTN